MIHLYGIPNCNTVNKAIQFLKDHQVAFAFHDFKKENVTKAQLKKWAKAVGMEALLNKKGTTWRGLSAEEQLAASAKEGAFELMMTKPSVIKRPVVEWLDGSITTGFDEQGFTSRL